MDPRLQAGVELAIEKTAEEARPVTLADAILRKIAEEQGVEQEAECGAGSPSSGKGKGMEDKNKNYGKGEVKLDDDPTKGKKAQNTGKPSNVFAGKHTTTEGSGMPDLSMKNASDRRQALRGMIASKLRA